MRLIFTVVFAICLVRPAIAQEATRFGVVLWESEANYFQEVWTPSGWVSALPDSIGYEWWKPYQAIAEEYARIGEFHGLTPLGSPVSITVQSGRRPWGDLYETLLTVGSDGSIPEGTFFWSGPASTVWPIVPDTLLVGSGLRSRLVALGDSVFHTVRDSYFQYEAGDTLSARFGSSVGLRVGASDLLVVLTDVFLDHGAGRIDDRGSLFQIVHEGEDKIPTTIFGHPEWAPISRSMVWQLEPVLFFNMEGHAGPLMLARAGGPWERFGYTIFDLMTGSALGDSY